MRVSSEAYRPEAAELVVTFFSVGQGDGALLRSPTGYTAMIDTGGMPYWTGLTWDPGREIVVPQLKARGIRLLHGVVFSHAHGDHIAGFPAVAAAIPVERVFDGGYDLDADPDYADALDALKERRVGYDLVQAGDELAWDPHLEVQVFNPSPNVRYEKANDTSVVLRVEYREVSLLFAGDAEDFTETWMASRWGGRLRSTVLKVPHHGSRTSSNNRFLGKVKPAVAVISCGRDNRYGHPHPATLSRLRRKVKEVYRTDLDGHVTIRTDGQRYTVILEPAAEARVP